MPKKLSDEDLVGICRIQITQSVGFWTGELSDQRQKALKYYYGEPFGNEVDGQSTFVSRDVLDVVEAVMPQLMKIFVSGDEIVKFEAQAPDREEQAAQATDYLNYLFLRKNKGFMVAYNAIKDGLLQKMGFAKVYWEEYEDYQTSTYENLSEDELAKLIGGDEVEVLAHSAMTDDLGRIWHSVKVRAKAKMGRICVESVPPEEMLVARGSSNDIQNAAFVGQRMKKTVSDLKEMGYEVEASDGDYDDAFNQERLTRFEFDEETPFPNQATVDESTREVWVTECYLKVDRDGDGIAELMKVTICGTQLLDAEEVDRIPFVSGTPLPIPHKFFGMSLADLAMDIQEIKSFLNRQVLDNAALLNYNRYTVMEGMANYDDLLTPAPGGFIRVKSPMAVTPLPVQPLGNAIFQHIEYFDTVREQRTGVTRYNQGLDANSLNKTATGIRAITSASMERILLIARVYAETFFTDLFWSMLELVCKHERDTKIVKLRGKYVEIDPQEWKDRFDMSVTVGLGTGDQTTMAQGMQGVMQVQELIAKSPFGRVVTEQNVYNAAMDLAKTVQPKKAAYYFTDPSSLPPPQPQEDPKLTAVKLKIEAQAQQKAAMMAQKGELETKRMALDLTKDAANKQHEADMLHAEHLMGMDKSAADFDAKTATGTHGPGRAG